MTFTVNQMNATTRTSNAAEISIRIIMIVLSYLLANIAHKMRIMIAKAQMPISIQSGVRTTHQLQAATGCIANTFNRINAISNMLSTNPPHPNFIGISFQL